MDFINGRKKGRIRITEHFLYESEKRIISAFFAEFFPVYVTRERFDEFEYYGISDQFRELNSAELIPYYTSTIEEKDSKLIVTFAEYM
jgi:hypothetical protein